MEKVQWDSYNSTSTNASATKKKRICDMESEVGVARFPRAVFAWDDENEVESNSEYGEAPTHCVITVVIERKPVRGLDSVV